MRARARESPPERQIERDRTHVRAGESRHVAVMCAHEKVRALDTLLNVKRKLGL